MSVNPMAIAQGIELFFNCMFLPFTCIFPPFVNAVRLFYDLFGKPLAVLITFIWARSLDFFHMLSLYMPTVTRFFVSLGEVVKDIQRALQNRESWKNKPPMVRFLYIFIFEAFDWLVLFFKTLGALWAWFIPFCILIVFYNIASTATTTVETNPALFIGTTNLLIEAVKGIVNVFLGAYNAMVLLVNPLLPLTWWFIDSLYLSWELLANFVGGIVGWNKFDWVRYMQQIWGAKASKMQSVQATTVLPGRKMQSIFSPYNEFLEPAAKEFEAGETQVVGAILICIDAIYDFLYSIADIFLGIIFPWLEFFMKIMRFIAFGAVCLTTPAGALCGVIEIVVALLNATVMQYVTAISATFGGGAVYLSGCGASELTSVPCICAYASGGIFENKPVCPPTLYTCYERDDGNGNIIFEEGVVGGDPNAQTPKLRGSTMEKGCPNYVREGGSAVDVSTGRRLDPLLQESYRVCYRKSQMKVGWFLENRGGNWYFIGSCGDDWTSTLEKEARRQHLATYLREPHAKFISEEEVKKEVSAVEDEQRKLRQSEREKLSREEFITLIEDIIEKEETISSSFNLLCGESETNFKDTSSFASILHSAICFFSRLPPRSSLNKAEARLYDMMVRVKEAGKSVLETSKPAAAIFPPHVRSLLFLRDLASEKDVHWMVKLKAFHASYVLAHREWRGLSEEEEMKSSFGKPRLAVSFMPVYSAYVGMSRHLQDLHRDLLTSSERTNAYTVIPNTYGFASSTCYYPCPCSHDCAPNGNFKLCPPCLETNTLGDVLRLLAFTVTSFTKNIDAKSAFYSIRDCYEEIHTNPSVSPIARDNLVTLTKTGSYESLPNVKFCFGMLPPLPLAPKLTWSLLTFVEEACRPDPIKKVTACSCPRYYTGSMLLAKNEFWLPGIPITVYYHLSNGVAAFQYLWSLVFVPFLADIWATLIVTFWCPSNGGVASCPALVYAFTPAYALSGETPTQSLVCFLMHLWSFSYTLLVLFLYYIFFFHCRRLIWKTLSIVFGVFYFLFDAVLLTITTTTNMHIIVPFNWRGRVRSRRGEEEDGKEHPTLENLLKKV